jgi:hypothetical protein
MWTTINYSYRIYLKVELFKILTKSKQWKESERVHLKQLQKLVLIKQLISAIFPKWYTENRTMCLACLENRHQDQWVVKYSRSCIVCGRLSKWEKGLRWITKWGWLSPILSIVWSLDSSSTISPPQCTLPLNSDVNNFITPIYHFSHKKNHLIISKKTYKK